MANIGAVSRQNLPELKWHQKELTHKIGGVALAVLGALGVALSIGMLMSGTPLAVGGGLMLFGSIATIAAGIGFSIKPCWHDPSYVARQNKKAQGMTFEEIRKKYGTDGKYLSKTILAEKKIEELKAGKINYSNDLIDPQALKPLIKAEVEANRITIKSLGFCIGNLYKDEPWFKEAVEKEIRGKSLSEMANYSVYGDFLSKEVLRQVEEIGFEAFYKKNTGWSFYSYCRDIPLLEAAKKAVENKSIKEIIDLYGWEIFTILNAREFRAQFEAEVANLTGEQIYKAYGNRLLHTDITTRKFLQEKIDNCRSIEQVFEVRTEGREEYTNPGMDR